MNNPAIDLANTDEDAFIYEVSDEALEIAAAADKVTWTQLHTDHRHCC